MTKLALVNGIRREAEPGLRGQCTACDSIMVPKCGTRRIWHWSHLSKHDCDSWHEPETAWHREWKNKFPTDWQEISLRAPSGEIHRADVRTKHGQVLEFQHSPLSIIERRSREIFYRDMFWIVDGLKTKRAKAHFFKALRRSGCIDEQRHTYLVRIGECSIFSEWAGSTVAVFFDFGPPEAGVDLVKARVLWCLSPNSPQGYAFFNPVKITTFVQQISDGQRISELLPVRLVELPAPRPRSPLPGFERYLASKQRRRRIW